MTYSPLPQSGKNAVGTQLDANPIPKSNIYPVANDIISTLSHKDATKKPRVMNHSLVLLTAGIKAPYTIATPFSGLHAMNMKEQHKRPTLNEVMAYQNERVIGSFMKSFDVPENETRELFDQLKRMLWLGNEMEFDGLREQGKTFSIDRSLFILDEMWHTFILCTRDYQQFCMETFGCYIHHDPQVQSEADKSARLASFEGLNEAQIIARIADEKRWQYTYVFKKLGKDIFIKWYTEFHEKYTPQRLLELRQKKLVQPMQQAS